MKIDGTVTISIEQFEKLKAAAEAKESAEKKLEEAARMISKLVAVVHDEEYKKRIKEIDALPVNTSDKKVDKLCREAAATLRITISEAHLRRLVHEYIDDDASDAHYDLRRMTKKEFDKIPIDLENKEPEEKEE